jgi:hypothetical protein
MATVSDLCTQSLKRIGVIAQSETPSSGDLATAFETLNQLMDQWAAERLVIYQITRTEFPIVSGTSVYTVGSGADVNIARPVYISNLRFQDTSLDPVLEMGLNNLTDDAWAKIALKDLEANYPTSGYYNPTFPDATLTLWPVPTSATIEGVIYAPQAVAQFSATSDTVSLPPGYQRFITTNLAIELAPEFGAVASDDLRRAAMESKATIKRANIRLSDLAVDSAALVQGRNRWGYYNIYQQ